MLTSMKGEINSNTVIVGDFNTSLTPMTRSTIQKISKETQTLNYTINQLDLIDIYKTFQPKTMIFTFFSSEHGTFPLALIFSVPHVLAWFVFIFIRFYAYFDFFCDLLVIQKCVVWPSYVCILNSFFFFLQLTSNLTTL